MVIRDKFNKQYILKDCWLHKDWPTDIEIHQLLEDTCQGSLETDQDMLAIFGWED